MPLYQVTLKPSTPFTSPIRGDTLFGYACWEYKHMYGDTTFDALLTDYINTPPFVISDAFPMGTLPRPQIPLHMLGITANDTDIKFKKKTAFVSIECLSTPIQDWLSKAVDEPNGGFIKKYTRTHNSINRQTFTTDDSGNFAPYNTKAIILQSDWHIYIAIPETSEISIESVIEVLEIIGRMGYGGGKTRGLGKFTISQYEKYSPPIHKSSNAYITLAPYVAQAGYNTQSCYYKTFTRFGKMGDVGALSGNPFKSPILMINTGAIITPKVITPQVFNKDTVYIGQGIGGLDANGNGKLSASIPQTIHQGYTPVIPVYLIEDKK